jgi:hypothetical protein
MRLTDDEITLLSEGLKCVQPTLQAQKLDYRVRP